MTTYRVTIEPEIAAVDLFWRGVAMGVLTYVVLAIAYWVLMAYWESEYDPR